MTKRKLFFWRARVALTACLILFFSVNSAFAGRRGKRCKPACPPPTCCTPCQPVVTCGDCSPCESGAVVEMHGHAEHAHAHEQAVEGQAKPSVVMPTPAAPKKRRWTMRLRRRYRPPIRKRPRPCPRPIRFRHSIQSRRLTQHLSMNPRSMNHRRLMNQRSMTNQQSMLQWKMLQRTKLQRMTAPRRWTTLSGAAPDIDAPAVDPGVDPEVDPAADPAGNDPFALPAEDEAMDDEAPLDEAPADEAPLDEAPVDEPDADEPDADKPAEDDPFGAYRPQNTQPELRVWTDVTGKHQVTAQLFEKLDGKVRLLKTNGRFSTVSLSKLSVGDREYLAESAISARLDRTGRPLIVFSAK